MDPSQPNHFNAVIEKIERLYMGKDSSDDEDLLDVSNDDLYDTEDSFINDAELALLSAHLIVGRGSQTNAPGITTTLEFDATSVAAGIPLLTYGHEDVGISADKQDYSPIHASRETGSSNASRFICAR
ncbi:hypothetical protein GYH30_010253 [Glycine max]|nr:hypothetical protein GYH30_010253 [Glycine max]